MTEQRPQPDMQEIQRRIRERLTASADRVIAAANAENAAKSDLPTVSGKGAQSRNRHEAMPNKNDKETQKEEYLSRVSQAIENASDLAALMKLTKDEPKKRDEVGMKLVLGLDPGLAKFLKDGEDENFRDRFHQLEKSWGQKAADFVFDDSPEGSKMLLKKFKEKGFAPASDRSEVYACVREYLQGRGFDPRMISFGDFAGRVWRILEGPGKSRLKAEKKGADAEKMESWEELLNRIVKIAKKNHTYENGERRLILQCGSDGVVSFSYRENKETAEQRGSIASNQKGVDGFLKNFEEKFSTSFFSPRKRKEQPPVAVPPEASSAALAVSPDAGSAAVSGTSGKSKAKAASKADESPFAPKPISASDAASPVTVNVADRSSQDIPRSYEALLETLGDTVERDLIEGQLSGAVGASLISLKRALVKDPKQKPFVEFLKDDQSAAAIVKKIAPLLALKLGENDLGWSDMEMMVFSEEVVRKKIAKTAELK